MTSYALNSGLGQSSSLLQIRTAGKDVLASGTVLTGDSRNLEFKLAHLGVILQFHNDGTETKMEATSDATSSILTLNLYNFNNSIGTGTTAPLEIGSFNGRKLMLSFMVYSLSPDSIKTVHYTFMLS